MSRVKRLLRSMGVRQPERLRRFEVSSARAEELGANNCEFAAVFFAHDGRLIDKWTHYLTAYDRHVGAFRSGFPLADGTRRPLRFLEIGVSHGGSLQVWRTYLGPEAAIWGIDVDPRCEAVDDPDLQVRIGSQADRGFVEGVVAEMGGVDVVIDDGSHVAKHQRASFEVLFPLLADGGLYIAEDLHTAYWWLGYGGGYRRPGTFIAVTKSLVDGMHAWYYKRPPPSVASSAKTTISSVTFYDSMVVIEKRHHGQPTFVKIGQQSF